MLFTVLPPLKCSGDCAAEMQKHRRHLITVVCTKGEECHHLGKQAYVLGRQV